MRSSKRYTLRQLRLRRFAHTVIWTLVLAVYMATMVFGIAQFTSNAINAKYTDHSTSGVERVATVTILEPLRASVNTDFSVVVTDIGCYNEEPEIIEYWANPITYSDCQTEKHPVLVECADWELEELAKLAFLEAGSDWISDDCIRAVVEVVFNQLNYGRWGNSLHDVIFSYGNYEPAYNIPYTEPTERCREIVMDVYQNGISIPPRVMFFRAWYYHQWDGAVAEFNIDGVYFSSSYWCQ